MRQNNRITEKRLTIVEEPYIEPQKTLVAKRFLDHLKKYILLRTLDCFSMASVQKGSFWNFYF